MGVGAGVDVAVGNGVVVEVGVGAGGGVGVSVGVGVAVGLGVGVSVAVGTGLGVAVGAGVGAVVQAKVRDRAATRTTKPSLRGNIDRIWEGGPDLAEVLLLTASRVWSDSRLISVLFSGDAGLRQ